jgi:ubiquinone/menaquinone biosynthesis C-methylase UbiE
MDLFSKIAHNYDNIIRGFAIDTIKDSLILESDKLLLDLGGGTGRVSLELQKLTNEIVLLDRSFEMLQQASKKSNSLLLVQGVGEDLPFRTDAIPQIFANDTLHHIHYQQETLENCHRVLSQNGRMTIREYDPEYWKTKFLIFFEWVLRFGSIFQSPKNLEKMCKYLGFSVEWERLTKSTYILQAQKKA